MRQDARVAVEVPGTLAQRHLQEAIGAGVQGVWPQPPATWRAQQLGARTTRRSVAVESKAGPQGFSRAQHRAPRGATWLTWRTEVSSMRRWRVRLCGRGQSLALSPLSCF